MRVAGLYRFPVKGLGGETLSETPLTRTGAIPGDRLFGFAHDESQWDDAAPAWVPKRNFLQLAKDFGLSPVQASWDDAARVLSLAADFGRGARISARPDLPAGRDALAAFLAATVTDERRPGQRFVGDAGFRLTDKPHPWVSIISLATCRALGEAAGQPVDPVRFRGNILIDGLDPWAEFDWIGQEITIGTARLRVMERIGRCIATSIDPDTGIRDIDVPGLLVGSFGHHQCGVYAEVVGDGIVRVGDAL